MILSGEMGEGQPGEAVILPRASWPLFVHVLPVARMENLDDMILNVDCDDHPIISHAVSVQARKIPLHGHGQVKRILGQMANDFGGNPSGGARV
jgi:hypothetical protein